MKQILYNSHSYVGFYVYYLINKNEIVYIGSTSSLGRRLGEHGQWLPFITCGRKAQVHPNKRITRYVYYNSYPTKKDKKFLGYGLCRKEFTHYSYTPVNGEKMALDLEAIKRKKHNPKYNNHRDYHWVPTNKKYTIYKSYRSFERTEEDPYGYKKKVYPELHYLMTWEKKIKTNSGKKIVQFKDKDGDTVTYNKRTRISEVWKHV